MARARRGVGWTAVVLALGVVLWGLYLLLERLAEAGPRFAANRLLLQFLTLAITVLALALVGVLIRNLVRLVVDRKRGILGAKLRTKLVFFFLGLVLLPALVLSYGAGAVIKMTVDSMLRSPVEDLTRDARRVQDELMQRIAWRCRDAASTLAAEASRRTSPVDPDFLEEHRRAEGVEIVVTIEPDLAVRASDLAATAAVVDEAEEALRVLAAEAVAVGGARSSRTPVSGGLLVAAAEPMAGGPASAVAAGVVLPEAVAAGASTIDAVESAFRQLRSERRDLLRLYFSLIALIGLATVFVAAWIGFYLSRRITVPLQELAAASREISAGNLGVRVEASAGDEVGLLVDAFNEMAAQLQESREVITRSTADLRRSNQALEERRRYIETLIESLSTAIVSIDRNGRVTTANPAVRGVLGLQLQPGDELGLRLEGAGLAPLRELLQEAAARGGEESIRRDLVLARIDEPVSASVRIAPLRGSQGEPLGTLVVVEDLSDLLRAQRAAAWQEVARRIAHEIKNPLTPIQLSAQRLRKKYREGSADLGGAVESCAASIEREVRTLQGLVDEFSRFARLPEPDPRPVDVRQLIDSVLELYEAVAGVTWTVRIDPEIGDVLVDPDQIRRVLINLIDNAVAVMGEEGSIRVAAERFDGPGSLRLEVADTGPGIPPSERDRLFAPYFSTRRRGTGLGLAIVHRVVTDHGGTIRVEDNDPSGARFIIEIPAPVTPTAAGKET